MTQYYRRHLDDRGIQRRWIDPRLFTIRVADVRAYLLRKGWREVPPDQPGTIVFEEPGVSADGPLYQWLPDSEMRRDYNQALYELMAALAEIENRYAGDVLTDVLATSPSRSSANGPRTPVNADAHPE